jgi:hypothetical protein
LAGQDLHLLDDTQSFMVASQPPIPFDPQGLVALNYLSSRTGCCLPPNWASYFQPSNDVLKRVIAEMQALPLKDEVKEKWLYRNVAWLFNWP